MLIAAYSRLKFYGKWGHRLKIEISPISVSPKFLVKIYGYRIDFEKLVSTHL